MPETRLDLIKVLTGVFTSTGLMVLFEGPASPYERWSINRYVTKGDKSCSLVVAVAPFIVSTSTDVTPWIIDGTNRAENDTGGIQADLNPGELLVFKYSGGRNGTRVTATFYGTRYVRGDRSYGGR